MKRNLVEKIRWGMLRTQRSRALASLYRNACRLVTWRVGHKLAGMPGVVAVFSRHTHPGSTTFVPGHSDIDLTVVLADEVAENPRWIRKCSNAVTALGRVYLFIKAQDARFISQSELSRLTRTFCSPSELLYRPEDWLLIAGREVRTEDSLPFPPHLVPRHPEFNKWWENIVQTQFFSLNGELDRGFMRSLYRSALKNQLTLQAARGVAVRKPEGFVDDELPESAFGANQRLQEILADLKRRNFWVEEPKRLKAKIFLDMLNAAEDFFENRPLDLDIATRSENGSRVRRCAPRGNPSRSVYQALKAKIEDIPELTYLLRSAVAYPLPHAHPYIYRLDLVLRKGISADEFVRGTESLGRSLGRKNFSVDNAPVEFTLIPEGIYRNPLFFLGSACPFLLEHIQEFGEMVYGSFGAEMPDVWSRAELTDWCRLYLPYHMFTLRRRLEHGSPVLNFCQLASLRIFLERGERLTDPFQVRRRYFEEFASGDQARSVLDILFRHQALRTDNPLYDEAFAYLSDTYDRVESLLAA